MVKFKLPGIKTKEGLQVSGIYGLALSLLVTSFFPDIDQQDVLNTVQEVANWYKESEGDVMTMINKFLNLGAVGYLLNRLKQDDLDNK
jgi:hypothetical protein